MKYLGIIGHRNRLTRGTLHQPFFIKTLNSFLFFGIFRGPHVPLK